MNKITREFVTSVVTVILAIFAIAVFIGSGGSLLFYVVVFVAMALGFYNAWLISAAEHKNNGKTGLKTGTRRKRSR